MTSITIFLLRGEVMIHEEGKCEVRKIIEFICGQTDYLYGNKQAENKGADYDHGYAAHRNIDQRVKDDEGVLL